MMHTAVFAVMGLTVLSLAASHPTPDHKARENHAPLAEAHLRDPNVPLLAKNDFPRQQPRQLGTLATALLLTPLLLGGLGGGGGILGGNQGGGTFGNQGGGRPTVGGGLGGLGRLNRTSAENIKAYVVNIPGSPVPHLVVTQRHGNPGVPYAFPSAVPYVPPFVAPLEPPYASPMAVPLPYPSVVHGNVLPTQHFVSSNQLFVPILPSYEGKKEDLKPVIEKSVDESPSFRSGAMESS